MVVLDGLLAVFAMDERLDHAGVERAGPKQRNCRDDVLETVGLELRQEAAHARAFHLEDADGVAAGEQAVAVGIVEAAGASDRARSGRWR